MISKEFRVISTLLAIIGLVAFLFFEYQMRPDQLGGFKEGTEEYYGYQYVRDNKLKNADQCDDEKDDPEMNINEAFIKGCRAYFKK